MPRVFCRKRSERLICLLSMCNEPQIDQAVSECECAAEKRGAVSTQVYTDSPDRKQYPFCSIHSDLQSNVHHKKLHFQHCQLLLPIIATPFLALD